MPEIDAALAAMRSDPPPVDRPVLLAGPTASGKSALALALAEAQGRVVVNADALQVYDMWQVLTARPDAADCARAPHLLYGCVGADAEWSVGHWLRAMADLLAQHPNPVIVGGTGLYFRALTEGLAEIPPTPAAIRAEADAYLARAGLDAMLRDLDGDTAARIDRQNPARVQRAWEVQRATGQGLAAWQEQTPPPILPLSQTAPFVMLPQPDWSARRIATRFESMIAQGALKEVRAVLPIWQARAPWAKAIGAPELVAHLQGHISLSEAVDAATLATRQYAKRQRTWFRARMSGWVRLL
ncbi:tRNA (adenosine(37)-N6)-dimethylallyltransferase MiaA [Roseibaca sp. Y0-43]|uniref:tRNA (adenosine(37)-N6)-dimethylallyltransferase MiaA n=1 Tax=Roseibaca sp. Y0-43 TaxID=2816854 RepID=UPI001D0CBE8B|nr:tRNA (adenosine(37)-N6)-dimethylallyltransferase MiaA [Roseibaca sp. Y0-43]